MNRAVSSTVSHALPGALREALDLTLPVLLPAIVERVIESVLPGMLSDVMCLEVGTNEDIKRPTPSFMKNPLRKRPTRRQVENQPVVCLVVGTNKDIKGPTPSFMKNPLRKRPTRRQVENLPVVQDRVICYTVSWRQRATENVGNVGLVTPKEPRLKRLKLKSRFKLSPFVDYLDNDRRKSLKAKFTKWRRQVNAKERDVGINPKYVVGPEYFVEIEKARTHLSTTSGVRLHPGVSLETLNIQNSSFYAWNTLHPPDVECAPVDYAQWDVPTILIEYVEGSLPWWGQPWTTVSNSSNTYCCEHVVLVCNVEQHWVVCLLRIDAWEITLFDSLPSPDRVRQLKPLSRLIPYVIAKGGYFDAKSVAPRFDLMPVVSIPTDNELIQGDVHSCDVFSCMYIERMIACDFPQSSSMSDVEEYRRK
ncbi:hypothetical protein CASFOL_004934 [Castilleja foliolosa]|uniref:Ubiquitin-like protease family profile domain-containing protein n=1 Tax=Castilleja foliolosa TaxID=1961234 RepID=A0ABD3ECC4_9LAMI